jgi:hypothetical protein
LALVVEDAEVVEDGELEDELLQPATARDAQAMASSATTGALFLTRRIIPEM